MHIVDTIKVDDSGRLLLTKVFEKMPEQVVPVFDTRTKRLFFKEAAEDSNPKWARKVDGKNRVSLPKWAAEELGNEYYVCIESMEEHFVFPCKYLFVG